MNASKSVVLHCLMKEVVFHCFMKCTFQLLVVLDNHAEYYFDNGCKFM